MTATHPLALGLRRDVARLEADARLAASQGDERAALSRLLEADAVRAEIAVAEDMSGADFIAPNFLWLAAEWLMEAAP